MKYGAIKNTRDYRDINLARVQAPVAIPNSYKTDISMLPVENQGNIGSCVGHAVAKVLQYYDYKENGKVTKISPRYIYALSKALDGYSGEGTYPRIAAKITKDNGGATEKTVPNDTTLTHANYIVIKDLLGANKDALPFRTSGYAVVNTDIQSLCQAIYQNGLVTISLAVGNFGSAFVKPGNVGLHYVTLYGYTLDGDNAIFYFRNSWGENWGDKGNGFFTFKDFQGQMYDAMVFVDLPNEILQEAKTGYKYFSVKESAGLNHQLMLKLDLARGYAGIPFKITSGYRTKEYNAKVGGVEDSSHTLGLAVDILCTTSENRLKMVSALLKAGFTRLGIGKDFIHADIDSSKPQNVIWHYYA